MTMAEYAYEYVCEELAKKELDYDVLKKQYDDLMERYFALLDKSEKTCADCDVVACLCEDNKNLKLENYNLRRQLIEHDWRNIFDE